MIFKKYAWIFFYLCTSISPSFSGASQAPTFPTDYRNVPQEDIALIRDLILINYPPKEWKIDSHHSREKSSYDVAIIGGGMGGMAAGASLFREGVYNIRIFDQNPAGHEGPWLNYARMRTLRSPNDLMGPALEIPHLTFRAWFDAKWGQDEWMELGKIPNALWMDYLSWYRKAMQLPVENDCKLVAITPMPDDSFVLEFNQGSRRKIVKAHKVVLATGRDGFGGSNIPDFVKTLPSCLYAHTSDNIDFKALKDRRIAVIGVGASGFDAAAVALETGAKSVDMLMRRKRIPNVNKFSSLYYKSIGHGFYKLSNEMRWKFMRIAFEPGIPPPFESLDRLKQFDNFLLRPETKITKMHFDGCRVQIETNKGTLCYDYIILATGFKIDGYQQPELRPLMDQIALWEDHMPREMVRENPNLGRFPYLGPTFEFLPKREGTASYLKNLYCFNYGATLSHSLLSSDIPAVSFGARRLAEGIAADFFIQESERYLQQLEEFNVQDFDQDDYFPRQKKSS